jgi:hypothetical protein
MFPTMIYTWWVSICAKIKKNGGMVIHPMMGIFVQ